MIELTFLKKFMLPKQVKQKLFMTDSIFFNKWFKFQSYVCNRCHDLLMVSMNFSDIAILNIKRADYHCIVRGISKNETINLMQNAKMTEKKELYKT